MKNESTTTTYNVPVTRLIIMWRSPALSGKAREYGSGYKKIALVEIDPAKLLPNEDEPKMISERCAAVVKIHACRQLYYGEGIRSEGAAFAAHLSARVAAFNA